MSEQRITLEDLDRLLRGEEVQALDIFLFGRPGPDQPIQAAEVLKRYWDLTRQRDAAEQALGRTVAERMSWEARLLNNAQLRAGLDTQATLEDCLMELSNELASANEVIRNGEQRFTEIHAIVDPLIPFVNPELPRNRRDLVARIAKMAEQWQTTEREVQRLLNIVCDGPACSAPIIRRDDGHRYCSAGHGARWVNIDLLRSVEAALVEEKRLHTVLQDEYDRLATARPKAISSAEEAVQLMMVELRKAQEKVAELEELTQEIEAGTWGQCHETELGDFIGTVNGGEVVAEARRRIASRKEEPTHG